MIDDSDDSGILDADGDGWTEPDDCDDADFNVHPDAVEACVNGQDDDCDGFADGCDVDLEPNLVRRFEDPDAYDTELGFGSSMGFLERGGEVTLWISPQGVDPAYLFRAASMNAWPAAEISGAGGINDYALGAIATKNDLDGDGERDLVLCDMREDRVVAHLFYDTLLGSATLADASASIAALGSWALSDRTTLPGAYALGDMTADGADDLLFSGPTSSWLLAGPISGDMDLSKSASAAMWEVTDVWFAASVDFDGDGLRDLATASPLDRTAGASAGAAYVYLDPSTGLLEPGISDRAWFGTYGKFPPSGESAGWQVKTGDFDGDGRDDLAVRSAGGLDASATGIEYIVGPDAAMTGDLVTVAHATILGGVADDLGGTRGAVADFDLDGVSDLIVSSRETYPGDGDGYVSVLLGPFDGHLIADVDANLVLRGPKGGWPGFNVVDGDLDGDGLLELAIAGHILNDADDYVGVVDVVTPGLLFGP